MKSIYEIRRENLSEVIRRDFDNNQSRLAERMGVPPNLISRYETGNKNIGSKSARKIEEAARREAFWLDFDHQFSALNEPEQETEASSEIGMIAAANLRNWMKQNGDMSQQQVADASGVSQATINRFLRNEASITLNNLAAIAGAFGRSAYEMIVPQDESDRFIKYDRNQYAALPAAERDKIQAFIDFIFVQNRSR